MANETFEEFMSKGWSWRDGGGKSVELDTTLTESGKAADAKATGDAIRDIDVVDPEKIKEAVDDFLVENPDVIDQTLSTKIEQNATDISALKQKHQKEMDRANKEIALLKKQAQGILYDFELVESEAYEVPVPTNAVTVKGESHSFADLVAIEGKTVVWNQLTPADGRFSRTENGVTYTDNADGTIRVSGTATGGFSYTATTVPVVAGHKYFLSSCPPGGSYEKYRAYCVALVDQRVDYGNGAIFPATKTGGTNIVPLYVNEGVTVDFVVKPRLIDLTQMFGVGNEPTDLSDPRIAWVKSYAAKHPEYNPGQLVSAEVERVESVGRNLIDTANFTPAKQTGVEQTRNQDGSIHVKGTATQNAYIGLWGNNNLNWVNLPDWMHIGDTFYVHECGIQCMTPSGIIGSYNAVERGNGVFTIPQGTQGVYIYTYVPRGATVDKDLFPMITRGTTATAYSPYGVKDTIDMPTLDLRSAGSVADRADFLADKTIRKMVEIDLGSLNWGYTSGGNRWYADVSGVARVKDVNTVANIACADYEAATPAQTWNVKDKCISLQTVDASRSQILLRDTHCDTMSGAEFKAYLSGKIAIVERAEYMEEPLDVPRSFVQAEPGGVIRFTNEDAMPVPNAVEFTIDVKEGLNV